MASVIRKEVVKLKIFREGIFGHILSVAGVHLLTSLTIGVVGIVFVPSALTYSVFSAIFTIMAIVICFAAVYTRAWQIAEADKKAAGEEKLPAYKGTVLSAGAIVISLVLLGGYIFAWRFLTIDGSLATATGYIYNIVYILTTFAFNPLLGLDKGDVSIIGHLVMYVIPVIASTLGYIAGLKGFTISDKLMPMIYEKKK